ncbi:unnamed protein product [Rhizophagus irregularis]|nr:unnamed protein product [Rhizophagus irregularis]
MAASVMLSQYLRTSCARLGLSTNIWKISTKPISERDTFRLVNFYTSLIARTSLWMKVDISKVLNALNSSHTEGCLLYLYQLPVRIE